jgi:hypothetical protein
MRSGRNALFCDYLGAVLANRAGEIEAVFGNSACLMSVDSHLVDGPDSTVPVTPASRFVLYGRQGLLLGVLNRRAVRRICLT